MKTRKTVFFALFALVMFGALIIFGCDPSTPTPADITFTVDANTPSDAENTKSLDIKFSAAVSGLTLGNVSLTSSYVQKDSLTPNGQGYSLGITVTSPYAGPVTCMVTISKDGVSPSSVSIGTGGVVNNESPANYTVSSTKVTDNKTDLTFTLTKAVTLTASDITLTPSTLQKGAIESAGTNSWKLGVSNAVPGATITIKITNTNVKNDETSHTLSADTEEPPPNGGILVYEVKIANYEANYSTLGKLGSEQTTDGVYKAVEILSPRRFKADIFPLTATIQGVTWDSVDSSVATVDQNGVVTGIKVGKTYITAKSKDGSGKGDQLEVEVIDFIKPATLEIKTSGTDYNKAAVTSSGNAMNNVELWLGDSPMWFTTNLKNNGSTNDQSVVYPTVPSNIILKTTSEKKADASATPDNPIVALGQFSLEPKTETGANPIKFTLKSAYNPASAYVDFTVNVIKMDIGDVTLSFKDKDTGADITGSTIDFKDHKNITVTVTTDKPWQKISWKQENDEGKTGSYVTGLPTNTNSTSATIARNANSLKAETGSITITVTATDHNNKTKDSSFTVKYTGQ